MEFRLRQKSSRVSFRRRFIGSLGSLPLPETNGLEDFLKNNFKISLKFFRRQRGEF